jgi:3-hydroxymyristoyl/3-hydroxydecanoyl-(acyl carrier protein) dehydratase
MFLGDWLLPERLGELLDVYPPFFFLDRARVFRDDRGNGAEAEYVIDKNHWIYKSHMPSQPVFPGALLCEFLCQTAMVEAYSRINLTEGRGFLRSIKFTFLNKISCENGAVSMVGVALLSSCKRGLSDYCVYAYDYKSGKRIAEGIITHSIPLNFDMNNIR